MRASGGDPANFVVNSFYHSREDEEARPPGNGAAARPARVAAEPLALKQQLWAREEEQRELRERELRQDPEPKVLGSQEGNGALAKLRSGTDVASEAKTLPAPQALLAAQEPLVVVPAHPLALSAMFATYLFSCWVEKIWRFALPAVLALLHTSLLPVAVCSFVSQLLTFLMGPWVGERMDAAPRVLAFSVIFGVQVCAMLLSAAVTLHALSTGGFVGGSVLKLLMQPLFCVLVAACGVERICGLASGVAFERDWVVQLADPHRPIALANANAMLRRVDLFCEITGPLAFGWLLSKYSSATSIHIAVLLMLAALPICLGCLVLTDKLSNGVLRRPRDMAGGAPSASSAPEATSSGEEGGLGAFLRGWKQYLAQPVLPASVAYVLLFFNAVLSPGSLMTSFLTQRGVEVSLIGGFRGACAAMGFAATFVSAPLIARLGVLKAGAASLIFQAVVLAVSVAVYFATPVGNQLGLHVFLALLVLSRLGVWCYDVVDAQIFQTAIPPAQANLVGTTEVALCALAELLMLSCAIAFHDARHFGALAGLSMAAVAGAATVYVVWLAAPDADQRRLFPDEPHFVAERRRPPPRGPGSSNGGDYM